MSIFDELKFDNIEIGHIQSVDEMTIVPILGNERGKIAKPTELSFKRTSSYGTMVFENTNSDLDAIVPANIMVRGTAGQDHAMSGSGIVLKKQVREFNNACCIEETQGGYLTSQHNETDILPITLRKILLNREVRDRISYDKIWPKIKGWMEGVIQNNSVAHIRNFYDTPNIKSRLEEFAAEFEPVDNQIGAIIMFSGVPVGIEIMPSSDHWESYWKLLIRGCYGAEMVRLKILGKLKPSTLMLPSIPTDADPSEVKQILEDFSDDLRRTIIPILDNIKIKRQISTNSDDDLKSSILETTSGGGGDFIQQNDEPVYLSIVL